MLQENLKQGIIICSFSFYPFNPIGACKKLHVVVTEKTSPFFIQNILLFVLTRGKSTKNYTPLLFRWNDPKKWHFDQVEFSQYIYTYLWRFTLINDIESWQTTELWHTQSFWYHPSITVSPLHPCWYFHRMINAR